MKNSRVPLIPKPGSPNSPSFLFLSFSSGSNNTIPSTIPYKSQWWWSASLLIKFLASYPFHFFHIDILSTIHCTRIKWDIQLSHDRLCFDSWQWSFTTLHRKWNLLRSKEMLFQLSWKVENIKFLTSFLVRNHMRLEFSSEQDVIASHSIFYSYTYFDLT